MTDRKHPDLPKERPGYDGPDRSGGRGGGYLAGARAAMPFVLMTVAVATSFGVLVRSLGWSAVAPLVYLSIVVYAFSEQGRRSDRGIQERP